VTVPLSVTTTSTSTLHARSAPAIAGDQPEETGGVPAGVTLVSELALDP
jgi:hypothetical protein